MSVTPLFPLYEQVNGEARMHEHPALKLTDAERAAGVTPFNFGYEPLDPRRYASIADWSTVYGVISNLVDSYAGWYRCDHAQHPALTNCIVGYKSYDDSLQSGTVGYRCTVIGTQAMQFNGQSVIAGGTNTAIGYACMQNAIECSGNTAVGAVALNSITGVDSSHNNAFGYRVLPLVVNGAQNNCFGFQVCDLLTAGNNNHGFGENVLSHMIVGSGNHAFGYQSHYTKTAGDFSHAFGYQSLFSETAGAIAAITKAASAVITISTVSGLNPYTVGCPIIVKAAGGMTQINDLTGLVSAIGGVSGAWTVTVNINSSGFATYTAGGYLAPLANTAFGYRAGYNCFMRGANTVFGFMSLGEGAEPGFGNTVMGYLAGNSVNTNAGGDRGDLNTLVGYWAGRQISSGGSNVVVGQQAGVNITTGSENITVGPNSATGLSTALRNTQIGSGTGVNLNGNNNTALGYNAGTCASSQTYTDTTSLGANAVPGQSGDFTLGDSNVTRLRCQQTSLTAISDARFKKNIRALDLPHGALEDLQPVIFEWLDAGMPQGTQMGFIAQALDEWQTKWSLEWMDLVSKANPDRWEATPGKLLFPLILSFQKLSERVAALEGNDQWRAAH